VDPQLLAAGDHNGSTFYQHQKFLEVVRRGGKVEVSLTDGLKAVVIGLAAEHAAQTGMAVDLTTGPWAL
jgi:predicted dehydrogenase